MRQLFLATGRAIIDVCEEHMTIRVGDRVEIFNFDKALKLPSYYENLAMIFVVENNVTTMMPYMSLVDPLERALLRNEEEVKMSWWRKLSKFLTWRAIIFMGLEDLRSWIVH